MTMVVSSCCCFATRQIFTLDAMNGMSNSEYAAWSQEEMEETCRVQQMLISRNLRVLPFSVSCGMQKTMFSEKRDGVMAGCESNK